MHHSGNNHSIDVRDNFFERFAFLGRLSGKLRPDCARLGVRRDTQLANLIGDPIRQLMQLLTEFLGWHIAEIIF